MVAAAKVVLFEPDLLFSSKLEAAARRLRVDLRVVTELAELSLQLRENHYKALIVSLDSLEGRLSVIESFAKEGSMVVGYYSHVKRHLGEDAKGAGVETVLSRGAFVGRMHEIFSELSKAD